MRAVLVLVCALAACGGEPKGPALDSATELYVVAHEDDDILFMQPDLRDQIVLQSGTATVYVTAGDDGRGAEFAKRRQEAARAAYAKVTNDSAFHCGVIELAGHAAEHCRLSAPNVSLIFLGYPDGGVDGSAEHSLLNLWEGNIGSARTIAETPATYDQQGLVDALAEVISTTQPTRIHTLDVASTHGEDHSDHMVVGALTLLATAQAKSTATLVSYRGYNTEAEPANKPPALLTTSQVMLDGYGADGIASENVSWLGRRYAVGFRRSVAGALRTGGQCIDVESDGSLVMGDCGSAASWHLDATGELADTTNHCLDVLPTGELVYDACSGGVGHRFFVDDEGHIWASILPLAAPDMSYAHLTCLATGGGRVHATLCGQPGAPTWEFVAPAVSTARASLGFAATGRAVRIGDMNGDGFGDLCAVEGSALECAFGNGAGGFAAATTVTTPFAVDPNSLAIGPTAISTGVTLACGLATDGSGPLCTLANPPGEAAQPWAPDFAGSAVAGTSASLGITSLGTALTAVTSVGLEFASREQRSPQTVASWPTSSAVVWAAPLDGNPVLNIAPWEDFCVAGSAGPTCMPGDENGAGSAGVPWGYSLAGTPDPTPQDANTGALADIDGDGNADLCGIDLANSRVACARSQGRGFGPRTTLVALPTGVTPTALWLGDLNNDGKADACVDAGSAIVCALSP